MKKSFVIALAALGIMQGCGDGFKTSDEGLKYQIHTSNDGDKIKEGDFVTLNMVYRTDSDSVLFDTYKMGRPVELIVSQPTFKGDLMNGLMLLAEKDSATFLINADSLFQKTFQVERPAFITAGSMLTFNIKVEKVRSKDQMEEEMKAAQEKEITAEKANIDKYVADNKLVTNTTPSGLQYVIHKEGNGQKAAQGDIVVVHYEGRLLNGNKFDSSFDRKQPLEFTVGRGEVIKGWDEAFMLLSKGAKATLILPFSIAYGPGSSGPIPPYATLVFDVELVDIKKAQ
jgi:FKBP-type peptidyl-prolyl cis-trans isomerase FkpA